MRALCLAVLLLAVSVCASPGAVGVDAARKPIVVETRGYVASLAMDGDLVAFGVRRALQGPACARVVTWNVKTGARSIVSGPRTCGADDTSTGQGLAEIAVAGDRVSWLVNLGGISESIDELYTTSVRRPREHLIARARRVGDVDCALEGRAIGGLVGDAMFIAVNVWSVVAAGSGDCETDVRGVSLRTVGRLSTTTVARGPETRVAQAADRGRIAVGRPAGDVAVYRASGRLLREVRVKSAAEVALQADLLVVLTRASTIQVFRPPSGALLTARTVPAGAKHLAVHAGIAVYAVGRHVHALELSTGRSCVVSTAPRAVVDLALERAGAAYAYNSRYTRAKGEVGNVAFLPFARIRAALS